MRFTPTSILSSLIACTLFVFLLCAILKSNRLTKWIGKYIYLYIFIVILRIMIPFEFSFTSTVLSKRILPKIQNFLFYHINLQSLDVPVYLILLVIWITGIIICFARIYLHYQSTKKYLNECPICTDDRVYSIFSRLLLEYSINKNFKIVSVPGKYPPAIFGLIHPIILIPDIKLNDPEIYYILRHELGHYFYKDIYIKAFIELLCCIYWWNPIFPIFRVQVSKAIEIHNDCCITSQMPEDDKLSYLDCILKIARMNSQQRVPSVIGFIPANNVNIKQRFICILDQKIIKYRGIYFVLVTLIPLLLLIPSFMIIIEPHSVTKEVAETTFEINSNNSYLVYNGETYNLYVNNNFMGTVLYLKDEFTTLEVIYRVEN